MSNFAVEVHRISMPVEHHPDADRLSLIRIGGYVCISAKNEDGTHRYVEGDLVTYVPEGAVVPEYLLKQGFWDEDKGKGILAGPKGDRVKAIRLRGIFSQGILFPVEHINGDDVVRNETGAMPVDHGTDVAEFLGITKYEPPVPVHMSGELMGLADVPAKFDFESIQRVTNLFDVGEWVNATEKLHGTFMQFGYVCGLNKPDLFDDGNIYVCSKGLGNQGLVFKNNEANAGNLYVRALLGVLDSGGASYLRDRSQEKGSFRLFGEIVGQNVQDLHYGLKNPELRLFDAMLGDAFVSRDELEEIAKALGVECVPLLYKGPFDLDSLIKVRDGKDTISQAHVREGIVIRSMTEEHHPNHGRKIGKWVSPDYLLRKGNVTEYQ